jgi:CBS domain-containing protein
VAGNAAREEIMKVDQVMTRNVMICRPEDTLNEATRKMWDHACGCLPVVDDSERVLGILTDRDVAMAAYTQGKALHELMVRPAMSQDVAFCRLGDPLETAERTMQERQVRRLPVLGSEGRLAGIITLSDIAREWERRKGGRSKDLSPDAIGRTLAAVAHVRDRDALREF